MVRWCSSEWTFLSFCFLLVGGALGFEWSDTGTWMMNGRFKDA